jgi:hypothetical protein
VRPIIDPSVMAPAEGLSPAECDVWTDTIRCLPPDLLGRESVEMLAGYCRHAVAARDLSQQIAQFSPKWIGRPGGLERYQRLLTMRTNETRAMLACARSLRITAQARYDTRTAARKTWGTGSFYDTMADDD